MSRLLLIIIAILPLLASCTDRNRETAEELRKYALTYLDKDTTEYSRNWKKQISGLHLSSEADRNKLQEYFYEYGRHGHESVDYIVTKGLEEGLISILEEESTLDEINTRILLNAYIANGAILQESGMQLAAYDSYIKGLRLAQGEEYDSYRAKINNNIGVIFFNSGDFVQAEKYFRRALGTNLKNNDKSEISLNYDNLAYVLQKRGHPSEALDMSLKGIQYINPHDNPEDFYSSHIFLGKLYAESGENEIAKSYLVNAMKNMQRLGSLHGEIEACYELSRLFLNIGERDSALQYAKKSLELSSRSNLQTDISTSLSVLANAYQTTGDYASATRILERQIAYNDSLQDEEYRTRLSMHEKELANTIHPEMTKKSFRSTIPIVFLLILIFIATGFMAWKIRKLKIQNSNTRELQEILSQRNHEITMMGIDRMKVNEEIVKIIPELKELLIELNPKAVTIKHRIKQLISSLDALTSKENDEFKTCFERVNPKFYEVLRQRYPNLTPREERLCGLLYLRLSTKEIAVMTSREVRSVESSRARLRHKLGISSNEDLSKFLQTIVEKNS